MPLSRRFLLRMLSVASYAALAASGPTARADDACMTAPVQGQQLQRAGKLLAARDRFATCARKSCPAEIVADCTQWAQQVASALPSVVLAAHDPAGHDLVDARVSIDGQPDVRLSARAVELDPGSHHFVFRRQGNADVTVDVLLREGEKDREVGVAFGMPAPAPESTPAPAESPHGASSRPIPLAVWIIGGIGVLGMASFAGFGAIGVSDRSSSGCDVGCSQSDKSRVDTELRVADISLAVGVVGLGVATWLFLARPTVTESQALVLDVHPMPGGGVATLGARF
jgi:hypothetical protein